MMVKYNGSCEQSNCSLSWTRRICMTNACKLCCLGLCISPLCSFSPFYRCTVAFSTCHGLQQYPCKSLLVLYMVPPLWSSIYIHFDCSSNHRQDCGLHGTPHSDTTQVNLQILQLYLHQHLYYLNWWAWLIVFVSVCTFFIVTAVLTHVIIFRIKV